MARLILMILVMVVAETAWALFAAATSVNLLLFYLVLIAGSVVFFIPQLTGDGRSKARAPLVRTGKASRQSRER